MDPSDNWTDIIKEESHENLKPIKNNINNINDMEYVEMITIDEFTKDDDIDLLKRAAAVSRNLKLYINKKYNNCDGECYEFMYKSIEWVGECTKLLADRNFQQIIFRGTGNKSNNIDNVITRNSYKFCEFNHECKFNYTNVDVRCYAQHFVYNLVHDDVVDVLKYMSHNKDAMDINEIKVSINTITYVLNHMFDELTKLKLYMPDKYQNYIDRKYRFKCNLPKNKTKKLYN